MSNRGFTLIEMLVAIVIVGAGLAAMLSVFSTTARGSADPVVQQQALAIAEELMEEILARPFATAANTNPGGCARHTFNDVRDYHGYPANGKVCTQDGTAIPSLARYTLAVQVQTASLAGLAGALRVQVSVTEGGQTLSLVGWRTNYAQ